MMTVMLNIVQFAWWTVRRDKSPQSHCQRYGPVYMLIIAAILINIQPMCMLIIGSWHLSNFFFNGGDFGAACTVGTDCGSGTCASDKWVCDPLAGSCLHPACGSTPGEVCGCGLNSSALVPNTPEGWAIQICGTYLGFIFLFIGVMKATKLGAKLKRKWREIRSARALNASKAGPVRQQPDEEEADCTT